MTMIGTFQIETLKITISRYLVSQKKFYERTIFEFLSIELKMTPLANIKISTFPLKEKKIF